MTAGAIKWHCSYEDSGPDVGKSITLPDGTELYFGEISRRTWEAMGGSEVSRSDTGWWIVHWRHDGPNVLGRALEADFGQVETLASAIEARRAGTVEQGSIYESAPGRPDAS